MTSAVPRSGSQESVGHEKQSWLRARLPPTAAAADAVHNRVLEDVLATRVCTACVRRRTHLLARLIFRGLLYLPLPYPNLVLWILLLLNRLRLVQYDPCNPTVTVAFSTVWHTGAHPKIRAAAFRHYRGAYSTPQRTRARAAASSQRQQSLQNDLQLLSLPSLFPSIQTFRSVRRAVCAAESGEQLDFSIVSQTPSREA